MQGAIEETARAFVHGAIAPGTEEQVRELTAALTETVAEVLARDIPERIVPATVEGMRASLREALSPEDRRAVLNAVGGAVAQATTTAIRSASVELPRSLAPAMRAALVDSLNSPDLHEAIAGVTADAMRSALLSSRDLIIELHDRSEGSGPIVQLIDRMQRMLERTIVVTFCIGALLGAIAVWASRHFRRGSGSGPPGPAPSEPASWQGRGPSGERAPARLDPSATRAT